MRKIFSMVGIAAVAGITLMPGEALWIFYVQLRRAKESLCRQFCAG